MEKRASFKRQKKDSSRIMPNEKDTLQFRSVAKRHLLKVKPQLE